MPDTCLFCRMISREAPTPVAYESDMACAFLDHRPLFLGHCLVVRILIRLLALAACLYHNYQLGRPSRPSLITLPDVASII